MSTIAGKREWGPVFVVGSARSGTTLMYHMLLSTGEYAQYRGEPAVFDLLAARYGDLGSSAARQRLRRDWPRSQLARAGGFDDPVVCDRLIEASTGTGDFLVRVMSAIAAREQVPRWAVWGPDNLLLMPWIKREIPNARFIHMIRDGRDIALSMHTEGFIRPLPWDRAQRLLVSALHWQWKLCRGQRDARALSDDYLEVRFEALVRRPHETLTAIADFIGHALDYEQILQAAVGTVRDPNSTFRADGSPPVERWRQRLTPVEIAEMEHLIGDTLESLGYARTGTVEDSPPARLALTYPAFFTLKHVMRTHTPLGRRVDVSRMRLETPTNARASAAGPVAGAL